MKTFIVNTSCQGDLPGEERIFLSPFPYDAETKKEAEERGLKAVKYWYPEDHHSDYKVEVEVINEVLGNTNG